jgi:hypothetical protein
MKKQALTIGCVAAILLIFSVSSVFSWGSATHAYIGNKIGAKGGLKDFDEMYGSLAPDVFNYTFAEWYEYIYKQTHYITFNLKGVADEKLQKALAYVQADTLLCLYGHGECSRQDPAESTGIWFCLS